MNNSWRGHTHTLSPLHPLQPHLCCTLRLLPSWAPRFNTGTRGECNLEGKRNVLTFHWMHLFWRRDNCWLTKRKRICRCQKKKKKKLSQGVTVKVGLAVYWVMKLFFLSLSRSFSFQFHGEATDGDYAGGRTGLLFPEAGSRGGLWPLQDPQTV